MGSGHSSARTLDRRNLGREVDLSINGVNYKVSDNVPANTTLNTYIREYAHLKGTKFMCLEGGCGACIVGITAAHPSTGKTRTYAVNSCLIPIFACHGWSITTIEGIGDKKNGFNRITKRLAAANGTQCGYCSPGMVMNMYCLLDSNPKVTMKEVENSFGSNICRCTGYRPIMDAFKSMATDAPTELKTKLRDIEDMMCSRNGEICLRECNQTCKRLPEVDRKGLYFQLEDGSSWFRPADKKEVFEVFDMIGDKSYRLIAGNTGHGVYRNETDPEVYIDLNAIPELHSIQITSDGIVLGANVNLTEAMDFFYKTAKETPNRFAYCQTLADHIDLIASIPVRNAGTIGGNLFMKHVHHEFPSDVFLSLEMVGAQLTIVEANGQEAQVGMLEFLKTDMKRKLILNVLLPSLDNKFYVTRSFKIMPRAQNAHAYVNAGFKFKLDPKSHKVLERPTMLFGGIDENFLHASKTENYLKDKNILTETTLKGAMEILETELKPDHVPPDATPEYRRGLALSLFYKFVLSISPKDVNEKLRSGGPLLQRPVSSAHQDFDTDAKLWPLNKPIPKIEGLLQCSGEAEYVNDIPNISGQLWAQLVLCDRARAVVAKIDPSEALKMEGVVAFFSAEDIPGVNNFFLTFLKVDPELVFTEGRTNYAGEAIGVIVAESHALAIKATKFVKIEYTDQQKVVINGRDIIKNNMTARITDGPKGIDPVSQGKDVKFKIKGQLDLKSQYHYTMEPLTCLSVPHEDELDVYPTSQWPVSAQEAVMGVLKLPQNKINIHVRRLGGGYGGKITRICHTAAVASLAAYHLKRPVRLVLNIETNMAWAGKRFPAFCDYEAGVNADGVIQFLNLKSYQDNGYAGNDSPLMFTPGHIKNCYDVSTWDVKLFNLKTDNAGNTWCRAPGSTEGVCFIETIMEQIANTVGKDPIQVRLANMAKGDDNPIPSLIQEIMKSSDYDKRVKEIEEYNAKNRWKKRGISLVPMTYPLDIYGFFHAIVSIFGMDGTVSITHGGVEMGQGINTKVVQVAAHFLGIDIWKISVKPFNINVTPNDASTGGSIGSECVCYAVQKCCEELNKRLEPIKKELGEKATWEEIAFKAYTSLVDLQATYMEKPWEIKSYSVHGVTVLEVEVDVLTGQYHTRRVDLLEDVGQSMSPEVDIGQIEGSLIMGIGYFTCEELVYNTESGQLYTTRTWNYKPPGAKDIPIDFRVYLRKNSPNPAGVLRSKATGEPPLCMSCAVTFSIRNALESARKDTGIKQEVWFDLEYPYTAERIWLGCLTKKEQFKLQ